VARKQLGINKVDHSRQPKHKKKGFLQTLAGYTHEQLKEEIEELEKELEEMRKEMKHRGVR
jgi:HAMP domain-containing protein